MTTWRCIKTVVMNLNKAEQYQYVAFTEGKIYLAGIGYTPSGERLLSFINDASEEHLGGGKWLFEHFVRVEE